MRLADKIATMAHRGAPLPYDAEVEYIESSGTQYIDTLLDANDSMRVWVDCVIPDLSNGRGIVGTIANTGAIGQFWIAASPSASQYRSWIGRREAGGLKFDGGRHTFDASIEFGFFVDGKFFTHYGSGNRLVSNQRFALFYRDNYTKSYGTLYGFKIDMGEKMDMIPVRFTNSLGVSEGAMYDRVSGQLFRNAGTGAFIIGPDVVSSRGGGTKCLTPRRSYRRFSRPSARFCAHSQEWEVAA